MAVPLMAREASETAAEAADGAAFDPLDGHAQVVEPHLGHAAILA